MKHSTLLKVAFNTLSLLHTTIPLVCPVGTTTTDTFAGKYRRLNEIFLATSNGIDESLEITDVLQSFLSNIRPEGYRNSVEYVTKVFQKRPRAPVDEVYEIVEYKDLHKLVSLVLERGFFRREYEEKDLTKHTPDSLYWAKHVILQKKLIDSLHHKDLFGHLYYQMISDMRALDASDETLSRLRTILNSMLIALDDISLRWLEYIGEDNDQMANNIEYLRTYADIENNMDNAEASDPSKILDEDKLRDIYDSMYNRWALTLGPKIHDLFAIIHTHTYVKMYELGNEATPGIIERYVRLYSNMRVFYLFAEFISYLGVIPQKKECEIIDYITMFSNILSTDELKDRIILLIGYTSEDELFMEISTELESISRLLYVQDLPMLKAMKMLSASLLDSIFIVDDIGIANVRKLAIGEEIHNGLIVPGSSSSSSDLETPGSAINDDSQFPTEMSNSEMGNNNYHGSVGSQVISWVAGTMRLLWGLLRQ